MRALNALVVVLVCAAPAQASPRDQLAHARDDFRSGKYAAAEVTLTWLLYPAPGKLAQPTDIVEAHILRGVALFETGQRKDATREVEAALYIDGNSTLDPQLFSEEAVAWFGEIKAAKEARDKAAAEAKAIAQKAEQLQAAIDNLRFVERRPYWVNFMPFGAGQFQNGHTKKGIFFAATEAVAAGTSIGIFAYLTNKYGYGGSVPRDEAADALRLQQVSIAATVVFYGVAIWGVVDALRNYKARAEIEFDEDLLPPDLRRQLRPKPAPPTSRLRLHPLPFPDGAGVGLTWEH